MAFRGEMYEYVYIIFFDRFVNFVEVTYVPLFKQILSTTEFLIDVHEIHQIAGVCQLVIIDHGAPEVCLIKNMPDEIGADEASPTRHQNVR